ncbi:four helix bundle protein [Algoriphagus boritolerans]|uniref:four helix bundle protein n=1 Tax=Algoriphagus boritolerans TaxID=308111 RepID=UPI002FCE0FA1
MWKKARSFAKEIWELSLINGFKKDFSLRNQINSSSGSVPDYIAEGFEREGNKKIYQFLQHRKRLRRRN